MKLRQQFLRLHSRYGAVAPVDVTLDEVAMLLECTRRNMTNIVRGMAERGWIGWESSRGRGKRSTLRFLAMPEEIAAQSMLQAFNRKEVTQALEQIRVHARSSSLQEHLQGWLLTYFGHHSETSNQRQIDTLRIPIRQPIHTLDPLYMNLLAESFVSSHVFDGLVRKGGASQEMLPSIAHAWEADAGRTSWTFNLRKEVHFHDGRGLTAEDVVYSFERLMRASRRMLYSFLIRRIRSVRAMGPTAVRFELEEPSELFMPLLATSRAAIVPKDSDSLSLGAKPIGTGPFKIVQMSEEVCVLDVFAPYFQGRAHLDRVEIIHVPWHTASETGTRTGAGVGTEKGTGLGAELGMSDNLSPFHVVHNPATSEEKSWSQLNSETTVRKFITCNTQKDGPLQDPAVRTRIMALLEGESGSDVARKQYNLIPLRIATIPQYEQDALAIANQLESGEFSCTVACVPAEEFKGTIRLQSDLIFFTLFRDQDEQLRLFDLFLTISEHVDAHTRIDIDRRLKMIDRCEEPAKRAHLFGQIEELLVKEHQLFIVSEKPLPTAYLPSVRGVTFNSQGWVNLRTIWFPPQELS